VEQGRQTGGRDDLVQRIGQPVVGQERLNAGVELETAHTVLVNQTLRLRHTLRAASRVDARERNDDVGIGASAVGDLLVRRLGGVGRLTLDVDHERHRRHAPLTVVGRQLVDRIADRLGLEVPRHHGELVAGHAGWSGHRAMDMGVDVDGHEPIEVDAGRGRVGHGCRLSCSQDR
jgi:hypothetical protein